MLLCTSATQRYIIQTVEALLRIIVVTELSLLRTDQSELFSHAGWVFALPVALIEGVFSD